MTDRPTPEQIADTYQDDYSPVQYLRHLKQLGHVIVDTQAMRQWWETSPDAVDPYALMHWIETQ